LKNTKKREAWWRKEAIQARDNTSLAETTHEKSVQALQSTQTQLEMCMGEWLTLRDALADKIEEGEQLKRRISQLEGESAASKDTVSKLANQLEKVKRRKIDLEKHTEALRKQVKRFPARLQCATEKAKASADQVARSVSMKSKGVFSEKFRSLYRSLVDRGVAYDEVDGVIHDVSTALKVPVTDHVSARMVSRANAEGLIHSQLQIATELSESDRKF
jgi:chromosome segregation ATPase